MRALLCIAAFVLGLIATANAAVEPDEMLADPALEARAQALDDELRCVRCRSEAISSSNADWARDARMMVRELIADGATDQEVKDFFVARYGEYVLMRPTTQGVNLILWWAGPAILLIGGGVAFAYIRASARKPEAVVGALSTDEQRRLDEILKR